VSVASEKFFFCCAISPRIEKYNVNFGDLALDIFVKKKSRLAEFHH